MNHGYDNRHCTGSWLFSDLEFGQYVFHLIKTISKFILFQTVTLMVPEKDQTIRKDSGTSPAETDCSSDSSDEESDDITSLGNDDVTIQKKDVCSDSEVAVIKELVRKRLSTVSEESNSQMTVSEEKGSLV